MVGRKAGAGSSREGRKEVAEVAEAAGAGMRSRQKESQ